MQYYDSILCITHSELAGYLSAENIKKKIQRKQINRVRRASFESPALIEVASLPEKIQVKLREKYGDNFELAADRDSLKVIYQRDAQALEFYRAWTKDDGSHLGAALIEEYTVNASMLKALRIYYNKRQSYIVSRGGTIKGLWANVAHILSSLKGSIGHTLPENHRRLKQKLEEFENKGYATLVSGKVGNNNKDLLTADAKLWLLQRWANQVDRCASIEQLFNEYNAKAESLHGLWKPVNSPKTIYNYLYDSEITPLWYGARYGESKSKEKFAFQHKTKLPSMRDSLWYSDGTKLNYYYQYTDKTGKQQMGSLQVYEVMDAFSEVFLGFCISDKEDFRAQYQAYKMALQQAGYKPYQISFDNQGGHKKLENSSFLNKLSHLAIHTQPYNGKSKTIESAFGRFQSQILKKDWFFSGQNVTAHSAESKANMEYILANKEHLPTKEDIINTYIKRREEWNNEVTKNGKTRLQNYLESSNPQAVKLSIMDMVELFAVTRPREVTCTAGGISFREQNIRYDYMPMSGDGMPDLEWLNRSIGKKFIVKFDPDDMSQIFLYDKAADGSLRLDAVAKTKTVIHRGKQEQEEWEAAYIKKIELANKAKRIERVEAMEEIKRQFGTSNDDYGMNTPPVLGVTNSKKKAKKEKKALVSVPVSLGEIEKRESNLDEFDLEEDDFSVNDIYSKM